MAEKEDKKTEEKEFIIPLRRKFMQTPKYRRVPKAIKAVKLFIARHMKIYDKDLRKVKLDRYLNEEIWFRGINYPPAKIKVKVKRDGENVIVQLVELSEKAKFKKAREERGKEETKKKKEKKKAEEEARKKAEEAKKAQIAYISPALSYQSIIFPGS